jgi:hypothetical protein
MWTYGGKSDTIMQKKKCIARRFTEYNYDDQIKKDEMGGDVDGPRRREMHGNSGW